MPAARRAAAIRLPARAAAFPAAASLVVAATLAGCAPSLGDTDTAAARAHIQALAGTIGTRPHGSVAAARARDYIVDELRDIGFTVRIQETDAVDERRGVTAHVRNVIAWLDGDAPTAVALVSHYDSRPGAPGAIDDGLGVAVSLAAARALAAEPRVHSLAVLVTDAEELGLLGARALVTDDEVARRVGAFINLEGMGGRGPMLLFEATGGAVLDAWTRSAAPQGTSLGNEIYRRMPNDTDFTILRSLGVDGINLAPIGDAYAYHTTLDQPARLSDRTLAHGIATVVSTVRALDGTPLPAEPGDDGTTFVDLAGRVGLMYPSWMSWVLATLATALAVLAWVLLAIHGRARVGVGGLALTALVGILVAAGAAAGLAGAAWLLPALRSETTPWYAAPWFFYVFAVTGAIAGGWAVARLMRRLTPERRVWRSAAAMWWLTLPVWAVVTVMAQRETPAAAFMFVGPLFAAALAGVCIRRSPWLVRVASIAPIVVTFLLWPGDVARLLGFMVPLSGWLQAPLPWSVYAAALGMAALMLAPPWLAVLAGLPRLPRAAVGAVATLAPMVIAGSAALALPAYSEQRPQRRALAYVDDASGAHAWWIAGGREPGADLVTGPAGAPWVRVEDGPDGASPPVAFAGVAAPYRYQTPAGEPRARTPAVVTAVARLLPDGRRQLDVTVLPRELVSARIRLPPGLVPIDTSLAGRVAGGRWTATHAAVPTAGITVRLTFGPRESSPADAPATEPDASPVSDLAGLDIVLTMTGAPGAAPPAPLPDWLPARASTWTTRAVFVVPVTPSFVRSAESGAALVSDPDSGPA